MPRVDEQREHRKLSNTTIAARLNRIEVGDEILFNERKIPLEAIETSKYTVKAKGPEGCVYTLAKNGESVSRDACADQSRSVNPPIRHSLWWVEII